MDLFALSEEEQVAMAIHISMQHLDIEETDGNSIAAGEAYAPSLQMDSKQVDIAILV